MSQELMVRELNGTPVGQRQADGYVNATELCKAARKKWADYWRLGTTAEFVQALAESTGIPVDSLIESQSGRGGGTWVHPRVATHLAQWCSPRFAAVVSGWVFDILTTGKTELVPTTGNMFLDHLETTRRMAGDLVEMFHRQQAAEARVDAVQVVAEEANAKAESAMRVADDAKAKATATAAVRAIESGQLFTTVIGFAHKLGRDLSNEEANAHGRNLSRHCRERGFSIRPVRDQDGREVNAYPDGVLMDYFDQVWGAAIR